MTFIPKKIRLLPLSVALVTALSLSTCTFAATYVTTTTYNIATDNVSVSSTVSTGLTTGEQVTYLVNKTPYVDATSIIYIDQKESTNSGVDFSFTTSTSNLSLSTAIKLGNSTSSITAATPGVDDVLFMKAARTITGSNTVLKSITLNNGLNYLTNFGTITNPGPSDTYGILFSKVDGAFTDIDTVSEVNALGTGLNDTVKKFPALGRNATNQFAVQLVNGGSGILGAGTTCYTRTYAIYNNGTTDVVTFGPIRTVTLNSI